VFAGFFAIWLVLDRSAAWLGSYRGEAGMAVLALVLGVAVGVEWAAFRRTPLDALRALGFRWPTARGLLTTLALCAVMLAYYGIAGFLAPLGLVAGWPLLAIGMFAQGGLAEELLFRGFVFGSLRPGRSFWRAAALSALPFAGVHLLLFATLDFAVAAASLMLAVSLAFPLAWLYERSGNSVWPPALLHFVVQAPIKLVETSESAFAVLALGWMAVSIGAPWLAFVLLPRAGQARNASS
jgi:membrane protease YdiL (CAAX protease family)